MLKQLVLPLFICLLAASQASFAKPDQQIHHGRSVNACKPRCAAKGVAFHQVMKHGKLFLSGESVGHHENLPVTGGFR